MPKNISIIGNGVYARALAHLFGQKHHVRIYGRTQKQDDEYLIESFATTGSDSDYLIISITTAGLASVYPQIAPYIPLGTHVILAMK
jgi:glycerol-3-phosphate dehydrogenase